MAAIVAYHDNHRDPHPPILHPRLHAAMHAVIETQVAMADPPAVVQTVARLVADGLDRHQAIHAMASVAGDSAMGAVDKGWRFDAEAYATALASLHADDWRHF